MQLQTSTLLLRAIEGADIHHIYKGLSHPDVIQYYDVSFHSLEATKEQMEWYAKPEQHWFAICDAISHEFLGAVGLNDVSKIHHKAEIGLWLMPENWGKGIMKEAMTLICQYGFKQLQLHRLEVMVDTENTNCKRAMAKLDFQYEGTLRECEFKNDSYISVEIYSK